MTILITLLHVLVCLFLILVVLLQTGKGADLAGAFGGGGSQTAFGARGATTLLHKLTTVSAGIFMATSLILAVMASRPGGTVVQEETPVASDAPTAPGDAGIPPPESPAELDADAGMPSGAADSGEIPDDDQVDNP